MSHPHRIFWEDFETGRRGFTDGELPDGPLVEEISAREFYEREALTLACGWPAKHHETAGEDHCPCGFLSPGRIPDDHWHERERLRQQEDEALS